MLPLTLNNELASLGGSNGLSSSNNNSFMSRMQFTSRPQLNIASAKLHQLRGITEASTSGNLSPPILIGPNSTSVNNTFTERQSGVEVIVAPKPVTDVPPDVQMEKPTDAKKTRCLGDFVFYEQTNSTDTFGNAVNTKTGCSYFFKKFERREYMKKLEPYMVMEGSSDKIYNFCNIINQSNFSTGSELTSDEDAVFVLFEPHYGDLHTFMKEKKRLEEPEARMVFSQCVEAVHACHQNGIIIRDIKLKKFVFLDPERTKIGLANLEDCLLLDEDAENDLIKSQQGCPAYVSPEVLNPCQISYSGKLSDSWSLGIILYTLLVGRYPFHHPTIANMFAKIARGKFQVPMPISLSMDARILLRSLIRVKPEERLLPHEILAHNWFRNNENERHVVRMMMVGAPSGNKFLKTCNNNESIVKPALKIESNDASTDDCCVPQLSN